MLLMLDEPSLGLAPQIVEQNARMASKTAQRAYVLETGNVTTSGNASDF